MTPEQEEQVRLALAAAARAEDRARPSSAGAPAHPVPPEVAARLDDVLAELVQGRSPEPAPAPSATDELAARRRRRLPQLLVAAAAVAVIAAAGGVVARGGLSGGGGASDSAASSTSDSKQAPETLTEGGGSAGGSAASPVPSRVPSPGEAFAAGDVPALHRSTLAADVRSVVRLLEVAATAPRDGAARRVDGTTCAVPAAPRGAAVAAVRLDGRPATLVALAPEGGTRVARIYSCDDGDRPAAVVRVPAG